MPLQKNKQKRRQANPTQKIQAPFGKAIVSRRPELSEQSLRDLGLEQQMCTKFKWDSVQSFQLHGTKAQLLGVDTLIHVGTGRGKTAVAAGPHAIAQSAGLVTLFIAPLLSLHFEMVKTFETKYGLKAIAVNSVIQEDTKQVFKDVISGQYNIVILSPEMLVSPRFVDDVLRVPEFRSRILSAVVDEAHCISHWGFGFRKAYGDLGILKTYLIPGTPIVAMSGTLVPRVRRDVCSVLRLPLNKLLTIDEGNDRPNVSYIVIRCKYPLNSFRDLDVVLPPGISNASSIPKMFIYVDCKNTCYQIVDYIRTHLPPGLSEAVRPFNASHTNSYKEQAMAEFTAGSIRILVCTEAAGMGCDLPDVDLVVQWRIPKHLSAFLQRSGRVARNLTRTGVAILFAEPSAFTIDPSKPLKEEKSTSSKQPETDDSGEPQAKKSKRETAPASDAEHPTINDDTPGEGIYWFIQFKIVCRRKIITLAFKNPPPCPTVSCCDLCDPSLLARFVYEPKPRATRSNVPKGVTCDKVVQVLKEWRGRVHARDYPTAMWDSTALLQDSVILRVAGVGPITAVADIDLALRGQWQHLPKYRDELFQTLSVLEIPPFQPAPRNKSESQSNRTTNALTQPSAEYDCLEKTRPVSLGQRRKTAPTGKRNVFQLPREDSHCIASPSTPQLIDAGREFSPLPRSQNRTPILQPPHPVVPSQKSRPTGVSWQTAEQSMALANATEYYRTTETKPPTERSYLSVYSRHVPTLHPRRPISTTPSQHGPQSSPYLSPMAQHTYTSLAPFVSAPQPSYNPGATGQPQRLHIAYHTPYSSPGMLQNTIAPVVKSTPAPQLRCLPVATPEPPSRHSPYVTPYPQHITVPSTPLYRPSLLSNEPGPEPQLGYAMHQQFTKTWSSNGGPSATSQHKYLQAIPATHQPSPTPRWTMPKPMPSPSPSPSPFVNQFHSQLFENLRSTPYKATTLHPSSQHIGSSTSSSPVQRTLRDESSGWYERIDAP